MRYFVKLSFSAKERPVSFAPGGNGNKCHATNGVKCLATARPAGFAELKRWANLVDGTAIDADNDLDRFVGLITEKAADLSNGKIHIRVRGSMIVAYCFEGRSPNYRDTTLLIFTVNPVRATINDREIKFL